MNLLQGSTGLWASTLVAVALSRGWVASLILLKPTLLRFALVGVRDVRWWGLAAVVLALTIIGPWRDYLAVATNAQDLDYVWNAYPLISLPLIGWRARRQAPPASSVRTPGDTGSRSPTQPVPPCGP